MITGKDSFGVPSPTNVDENGYLARNSEATVNVDDGLKTHNITVSPSPTTINAATLNKSEYGDESL